jgi:hypothetical protein
MGNDGPWLVRRATSLFQHLVENVWLVNRHGGITIARDGCVEQALIQETPWCLFTHVERRPFLPPIVKARLILLSVVGEVGLMAAEVLPERRVSELSDDWDEDLLRRSSARMSSKETLR